MKRKYTRKQIGSIGIIIGLGLALILGGLIVWTIKKDSADLTSVTVIKAKVARHYELPTDEQPALATITDRSKLNSAFLKKAQNGDKVLIYQKNQVAIIYRPSSDRIIAVGPVVIDTPQGGSSSITTP